MTPAQIVFAFEASGMMPQKGNVATLVAMARKAGDIERVKTKTA